MNLRILFVAYPLLAISESSCGGAEQVLLTVEREMSRRGHRTVVAAAEGSNVSGTLSPTGKAAGTRDAFDRRNAEHNRAILHLLAREHFDLVHDMSGTFLRHAAKVTVPVLATLHLPPALYGTELFDVSPLNLHFNCVSRSQLGGFDRLPRMLGVVENGIDLARFEIEQNGAQLPTGPEFLLWMGRICEEKGPHIAIDVAAQASLPIVIAGQVYPFSYHQRFFEREVEPRLKSYPPARFAKTPSFEQKLTLLRRARALLVTSQIDETSSLVAMEAMACRTPVIACRRGALGEVVEHGVTGFLVDSANEMVEALKNIHSIDASACRARAERLFSSTRMADDYLNLYEQVLSSRTVFKKRVA